MKNSRLLSLSLLFAFPAPINCSPATMTLLEATKLLATKKYIDKASEEKEKNPENFSYIEIAKKVTPYVILAALANYVQKENNKENFSIKKIAARNLAGSAFYSALLTKVNNDKTFQQTLETITSNTLESALLGTVADSATSIFFRIFNFVYRRN